MRHHVFTTCIPKVCNFDDKLTAEDCSSDNSFAYSAKVKIGKTSQEFLDCQISKNDSKKKAQHREYDFKEDELMLDNDHDHSTQKPLEAWDIPNCMSPQDDGDEVLLSKFRGILSSCQEFNKSQDSDNSSIFVFSMDDEDLEF